MATRTFGPSKGNRRPTTAIPGSSGGGRPAAQKGGGGNKAAGSVEPTAANTPTVTVSSTGAVSTQNFGPSPKAVAAASRQKARAQASRQRVKRIQRAVLKEVTTPKPVKAKGPELPKTTKPTAKPTKKEPVSVFGFATRVHDLKAAGTPEAVALKQVRSKVYVPPRANVKTPAQQHPRAVKNVKRQLKALRSKSKGTGQLRSAIVSTPSQAKIAKTVLKVGQREGASRKEKLAALNTGLQETGFKNLRPGENTTGEDAAGWREELGAYYTGRMNVKKSAKEFYREAKSDPAIPGGGGETPGELSQTVQQSAYPADTTYSTHEAEARDLLHQFNKGKTNPKVTAKLKAVEAKASKLGIATKANPGKPPPKVVKKYKSALSAMSQIGKKGYEYQWGGGHGPNAGEPVGGPGPGFDCSGAISAMLHSVGDLKTPLVSGDMGQALAPGPGAITVFYNSVHTFAYVPARKEYWGTSESNPGGGAGFFPKSVGDSEVASGDSGGAFNVGHVPGLGKKQARQLGILNLGPGGSSGGSTGSEFPGMTISPTGTTATVDSGAGTHQKEVGFSKRPLTISQQVNRTTKKLKALGVIEAPEKKSSGRPTMTSLEQKYGSPVV